MDEINKVISEVNEEIRLEGLSECGSCLCIKFIFETEAKAIEEINAQISGDDASALLSAIANEHAGLQNVDDSNQQHYLTLLQTALQAKIQVCHNMILLGA